MNIEMFCDCKGELTVHDYGTNNITFEDGYRCRLCHSFKPIEDDDEWDDEGY